MYLHPTSSDPTSVLHIPSPLLICWYYPLPLRPSHVLNGFYPLPLCPAEGSTYLGPNATVILHCINLGQAFSWFGYQTRRTAFFIFSSLFISLPIAFGSNNAIDVGIHPFGTSSNVRNSNLALRPIGLPTILPEIIQLSIIYAYTRSAHTTSYYSIVLLPTFD